MLLNGDLCLVPKSGTCSVLGLEMLLGMRTGFDLVRCRCFGAVGQTEDELLPTMRCV